VANVTEIIIEKSMRLIARGLAANRLNTVASGLENIPAQGPALMIARHYHHLFDGLALFAAISRPFHIVVTMDWVQNKRTKFFMEGINRLARWPMVLRGDSLVCDTANRPSLFTARDVIRFQREAMRQCVDLLVEGRLLVIFPEGYPNIDPIYTPKTMPDEFLPFKPGFVSVARAAERRLAAKLPIVPIGLHYERGRPWIGYITFGKPIYQDRFSTKPEMIAFIEREVRTLSGGVGSVED